MFNTSTIKLIFLILASVQFSNASNLPGNTDAQTQYIFELCSIVGDQMQDQNNLLLAKAAGYAAESTNEENLDIFLCHFAYDLSVLAKNKEVCKRYPNTAKAYEQLTTLSRPATVSIVQGMLQKDIITLLRVIICETLTIPVSADRIFGPGLWMIEFEKSVNMQEHSYRNEPITLPKLTDNDYAGIIKTASKAYELSKSGDATAAMAELKEPYIRLFNAEPSSLKLAHIFEEAGNPSYVMQPRGK